MISMLQKIRHLILPSRPDPASITTNCRGAFADFVVFLPLVFLSQLGYELSALLMRVPVPISLGKSLTSRRKRTNSRS